LPFVQAAQWASWRDQSASFSRSFPPPSHCPPGRPDRKAHHRGPKNFRHRPFFCPLRLFFLSWLPVPPKLNVKNVPVCAAAGFPSFFFFRAVISRANPSFAFRGGVFGQNWAPLKNRGLISCKAALKRRPWMPTRFFVISPLPGHLLGVPTPLLQPFLWKSGCSWTIAAAAVIAVCVSLFFF